MFPPECILQQLVFTNRFLKVNGPLMLDCLKEEVYRLRRYREGAYGHSPVIDCFATKTSQSLIASVMTDYYRSKYGLTDCHAQPVTPSVFRSDIYSLPDSGSRFAVVPLPCAYGYFDPMLWFVDITNTIAKSPFEWEILEPNRHLAIGGFSGIGFSD